MNDQAHIRVFSVDDHLLLNEGIAAIIKNQPDMQLVAQLDSHLFGRSENHHSSPFVSAQTLTVRFTTIVVFPT